METEFMYLFGIMRIVQSMPIQERKR